MKRCILLFSLVLVLFSLSATAQYKTFSFGLKAGPELSWIRPTTDKYDGNGAILGFGWGFVTEVNFIENYSFVTGFNILFDGGKYSYPGWPDGTNGTSTTNRKLLLKSLEIPVTLKMRISPINNITYFGQIGFGQNFLLSAKSIDDYDGTSKTNKEAKAAFFRESLIIGGGAEYKLDSGTTLGVNLTFDNSFTNSLSGRNSSDNTLIAKGHANFMELGFTVLF
jgi:hypothetical protein